jgi:hypothetical protein
MAGRKMWNEIDWMKIDVDAGDVVLRGGITVGHGSKASSSVRVVEFSE